MAKTIAGYADRLSVAPGQTVRFMVSCEAGADRYRASLVRLICTDDHPIGPGHVERPVGSAFDGSYPARRQRTLIGSCAVVRPPRPMGLGSFTVQAMIWPTLPGQGRQAIVSTLAPDGAAGFALELDEGGSLCLRLGRDAFATGKPLLAREWALVAASYDAGTGAVRLWQEPLRRYPTIDGAAGIGAAAQAGLAAWTDAPLLFAAREAGLDCDRIVTAGHFNGKIDGPRLSSAALTRAAIDALVGPALPEPLPQHVVGAWDFAQAMSSERIVDRSANGLHGSTVNLPARAMRGWNWSGEVHDWKQAPEQYGAIHFHDDDLADAGWDVDFSFDVPPTLPSGVYAARLENGGDPEHVVFFVRPPRGQATAKIAYIASTATYLAYANYRTMNRSALYEAYLGKIMELGPHDLFLNEHPEYGESLYTTHGDGSGVSISSAHRPIVNMRPNTELWAFNGDSYLTAWFDAMGHEVDVITDEDLHREGHALLAPYSVVVTGCHPEYATRQMVDALQAYVDGGGRLMYLGGNGFYWRIAFHPTIPGIIELRRAEDGARPWEAEPGEYYMSFTGEYGGLWRRQGYAPNRLVGVGFSASGFDLGSYYRRTAQSADPRAAFIFEGVGADELIGDFGVAGGGAAGQEIDRYDRALGSPPHALVVARSENHNDNMILTKDDMPASHLMLGGTENPLVRADMTFFETPKGGAVFSTGSISWCASLSCNGFDNNVSRITRNVLARFLDPAPFLPEEG